MSETTAEQIEAMRELCRTLEQDPAIKEAHPDDWGRFGNFALHIYPRLPDRHTTVKLMAKVRKLLPSGAKLRECFGPDPVRVRDWSGKMKTIGYSRKFWAFDVDYQNYDPAINRFSR